MATHRPMRSCRLADDIYLKAKYIADTENRSFNNWLENTLEKIVADYEAQHGVINVDMNAPYQ
jgi:hypothetical protein